MIASNPPVGGRISHYRILHPLGAGGMGEVYAALDETLQRRVALKAIRVEHRLDERAQARFLREARILSQLDHPNICRAYDYIRGADQDWLVLELIEGDSLRDLLKTHLDASTKLSMAAQIASVLAVTHAAGIVHRDLKPGNVMLTRGGGVKVLDFGIARSDAAGDITAPAAAAAALDALARADTELTRTLAGFEAPEAGESYRTQDDSMLGTLAYMSPEQAQGEPATSASDMFSYGLLLQEIFTGRRAYPEGIAPAALLERVREARTDPPRGTNRAVAELIRDLTALAPSQRPTAVDAVQRLRRIRDTPKRRLRAVAAATLLLATAGAVVKYTVDVTRERTAAVLARQDADRRRAQAEDLIGFMVGDLRTKLAKAGRLELLEDVGTKAMAYFASVPNASLTGEELSRRVQTVYQIGAVRQAQGNLKGAEDAYRDSLALAEQLAGRDPSNPDWQLRLAYAHFYLGDALRREAQLDQALSHFTEYRTIATRLVARDASNPTWQLELSYANGSVAAIQEARGELPAAREGLERALAIKQALVARDPSTVARQKDLAVAHNRLGTVLDKMGEASLALQHFRADLAIREALVAHDPADRSLTRDLYVALSFVSRGDEDRGDLAQAVAVARRSLGITSAMAAGDPANADWQRDLAVAENRLAGSLRWSGASQEAETRFRHARAILQPLVQAAPSDILRRRDLAVADLGCGAIALLRKSYTEAAALAEEAEQVLAPALPRADRDAIEYTAEGRLLAAEAAERTGDRARARQLRDAALAVVSPAAVPARDTRMTVAEARALLALGRVDEAKPLVTRLLSAGYRYPALLQDWGARGGATPTRP